MSGRRAESVDVEALNDRLALEHPSDDYYARSPWPIRFVEGRRLAIIRRFLGDVAGLEVAEIGSGAGHVLCMFPEARLTAIDVSGVFLEQARERLRGYDARFLHGEVEDLGLPDASFDRIICTEVLEHVVDPEALLESIARLLRPDGVAVLTAPNDPLISRTKAFLGRPPLRGLVRGKVDWTGDEFHLHQWTPKQFELLCARSLTVVGRRFAPGRVAPLRTCLRCVP